MLKCIKNKTTMKKIYIVPAVSVFHTEMQSNLMVTSIPIDPGQEGGGNLVKEDKGSWDIWGSESDNNE